MKTLLDKWGKNLCFNEVEISFYGEYGDYCCFDMDYMDLMVHIEENSDILRAYTYQSDIPSDFPKKWLGKPSKNPLFINLTKSFVRDNIAEIEALISESLSQDKE